MEFGYYLDGTSKNNVWPNLMPLDELRKKTAVVFKNYLENHSEVLNRNDLVKLLFQMESSTELDISDYFFIADKLTQEAYSDMADPYLAFQWYGYYYAYETNSRAYSLTLCSLAQCLMLFGTIEQRVSAVQVLEGIMKVYCQAGASTYWWNVRDHILFMAGVHPMDGFRNKGYDFPVINKDMAIEWYKKLIDLMKDAGDSDTAKWAEELEPILGIQYYQPTNTQKNSGTASNVVKQGSGCMVLPMCIALLIALIIWLV